MDSEKLRILISVLDCGSLTDAAQRLGYTPSGVSRAVASLKEEFGFSLLIRKHEGVDPTEACLSLLPEVREILHHNDLLNQKAEEILGLTMGSVAIGSAYSSVYVPLEKAVSEFHARWPGIAFHMASGFSTDLCEQLLNREIDFAVIGKREGPWDWIPLEETRMMAWVPADSAYASLPEFPLKVLEKEPYIEIYSGVDTDNKRALASLHIRPNIQMHAKDSYTAFTMVEAGFGIALNEQANCVFASPRVRILPAEPACGVEIGIACLPDLSPACRKFLPALKEALQGFLKSEPSEPQRNQR